MLVQVQEYCRLFPANLLEVTVRILIIRFEKNGLIAVFLRGDENRGCSLHTNLCQCSAAGASFVVMARLAGVRIGEAKLSQYVSSSSICPTPESKDPKNRTTRSAT